MALSRLGVVAVLVIAGALSLAPVSASAQSSGDVKVLMERIERLQRDVNLLQRQVYRGETPPPSAAAAPAASGEASAGFASAFDDRINRLEEEARQLTGRVEEVGYSVRQVTTRLDKLVRDVDARLSAIERQLTTLSADGAEVGQAQPGESAVQPDQGNGLPAGTKPLGQLVERRPAGDGADMAGAASGGAAAGGDKIASLDDPGALYRHALDLTLRDQDFAAAEEAFRSLIDRFPDFELLGNAYYWLGETYYVREEFERAAVTFAEGYKGYSDSVKAPDMLLKLGMSLRALGKTAEACSTFAKLNADFPNAPDNIKLVVEREQAKAGCGG